MRGQADNARPGWRLKAAARGRDLGQEIQAGACEARCRCQMMSNRTLPADAALAWTAEARSGLRHVVTPTEVRRGGSGGNLAWCWFKLQLRLCCLWDWSTHHSTPLEPPEEALAAFCRSEHTGAKAQCDLGEARNGRGAKRRASRTQAAHNRPEEGCQIAVNSECTGLRAPVPRVHDGQEFCTIISSGGHALSSSLW